MTDHPAKPNDSGLSKITPRMAKAGMQALKDLGYEGVEFTDAQKVYQAMRKAAEIDLSGPDGVADCAPWWADGDREQHHD